MARRLTWAQQLEAVAIFAEMTEADWLRVFYEWRRKHGEPMPHEEKWRAFARELAPARGETGT